MPGQRTLDLAEFLAQLPPEAAAELRAAAGRIDALEREIGPPNLIERNILWLGAVALALFALGVAAFIGAVSGLMTTIGLGGVTLMVAAFPLLVFAYLLSIRGHRRLDAAKMALNERHFLPHGAVYYGVAGGGGRVLLVDRAAPGEPDLRAKVQAQYDAATRRRW